jgi:two-component system nitrogen regulation response regulator NtrX
LKNIANILIVDDEKDIRESLGDILTDEGFNVFLAKNASDAIKYKEKQKIDLILLDIWMPDTDGISLLKSWAKNKEIDCPVLMMSGHGTIDTAIEATKIGATDFLEKPISLQKLLKSISGALKKSVEIDKIDKYFLENNALKYVNDFKTDLQKLKNSYFTALVGPRGNFINVCKNFLVSSSAFNIDSQDLITPNIIKVAQAKGTKYIVINNFFNYTDEKKNILISLAEEITSSKIKIIIIESLINEKSLNTLKLIDRSFEKNILLMPDLMSDKDLIPDLSISILNFYLEKNKDFGFKEFEISALNELRVNKGITNIDVLDGIILNLMINSQGEKITVTDINSLKKSQINSNKISSEEGHRITSLFNQPLRDARDNFEIMYFNFHFQNKISVADLAKKSGIERTHLYRKLKQLKIKF